MTQSSPPRTTATAPVGEVHHESESWAAPNVTVLPSWTPLTLTNCWVPKVTPLMMVLAGFARAPT